MNINTSHDFSKRIVNMKDKNESIGSFFLLLKSKSNLKLRKSSLVGLKGFRQKRIISNEELSFCHQLKCSNLYIYAT